MKQAIFAGALATALALTALTQQRAAAQCPPECTRGGEINFTTGVTFGCHWTPRQGHWAPNCCPCPPPYGYPPPGYPAARLPMPTPPPAPPAPPSAPGAGSTGAPAAVQNVGYTYPAAYGYDYGYGTNYGYPMYQAPAYWYGR